MRAFVNMYKKVDATTRTNSKIEALTAFFETADDEDKVWAIALFSHKRPKRSVTTTQLRMWGAELAGIPLWLFEESYHIVGDLAEAIALVLPDNPSKNNKTLSEWIAYIKALNTKTEEEKKQGILDAWGDLNTDERFIFNKLITGGFRMGISQKTMVKALAKATKIDENALTHRIMGNWDPTQVTFNTLIIEPDFDEDLSKPFPFYLAYPLEQDVNELGKRIDWQAEWKWDGIRGQLIIRQGQVFLWSRGEELITERFPEFDELPSKGLDEVVIDGEIMPYKDQKPMNFNDLQKRIGRKTVSKKLMSSVPVVLIAYDLLEYKGQDLRSRPLYERRKLLEQCVDQTSSERVLISPIIKEDSWKELINMRKASRCHHAEGIMLKNRNSVYESGRKKGSWWKWKVDPLTIDGVMIYAQRGHGRRANLYTDFTFAVWDDDQLVPFTKAYSGLKDEEFREITRFVRSNTVDRFGPVSSVTPTLVFEIAFEGIAASKRHKSGVALRFPRIKRWRKDKLAKEANTIHELKAMLNTYS